MSAPIPNVTVSCPYCGLFAPLEQGNSTNALRVTQQLIALQCRSRNENGLCKLEGQIAAEMTGYVEGACA